MAYNNLDFSTGADKFVDLYTDYNNTMDALKSGASKFVLTGNGATSDPSYQSIWSSFSIVGSGGGAPAFEAFFAQSGSSSDYLRFRKSEIFDTIEICGRFKLITAALTPTNAAAIFILPAGYLPTRPVVGVIRHGIDLLELIVDNTTGEVFIVNNSSVNVAINDFMDVTLRFSIS